MSRWPQFTSRPSKIALSSLTCHFDRVLTRLQIGFARLILESGSPKLIPTDTRLHLSSYSLITDRRLLRLLSKVCYGRRDVRAGWIGPGLPQTDYTEFKPLANWALQHWAMYSGFVSHAEVDDGDRILDVGCGTGHATVCLASVFPTCTIVGIDIDDLAVVFARSFNSGGNVCYVHSSFLDFWPSQRYAYIFALETLEHIQPARHYEFVDKCLGMLEEDGLLFLTTPNALDEADCTYGHVGLLNRVRARAFIHKYRKSIQNASFYDNQKLSSADPSRFIVEGPVDRFEDIERNRSHFQLVMRKT